MTHPSMPVFVSPKYMALLACLLLESRTDDSAVDCMPCWLNWFKNKLNAMAIKAKRPVIEMFPTYSAFVEEEMRLVQKDKNLRLELEKGGYHPGGRHELGNFARAVEQDVEGTKKIRKHDVRGGSGPEDVPPR